MRAQDELEGVTVEFLESQDLTDFRPNINSFIDRGCDLIVTVGFLLAADTADAAVENLVRRHVAKVIELAAPRDLRLSFLTPPARNLHLRHVPTYDRPLYNRIVERFAETLREVSAAQGLPLVDLHAVTTAPEGGAQAELYLDSNHVYPEAIVAAFRTS